MKPSTFSVTIPTKPYLAKYITARYGNPILLNNRNLFGIVVLSLLQKKVITHLNIADRHLQFRTFTENIICLAPYRYMSHYGVDLTDEQIIQLNRAFDAQFEEELYFFCQRTVKHDTRYKGYDRAIELFAQSYGIILEVDTTFECLKKTEFRFRKDQEDILSRNVPSRNDTNQIQLFQ